MGKDLLQQYLPLAVLKPDKLFFVQLPLYPPLQQYLPLAVLKLGVQSMDDTVLSLLQQYLPLAVLKPTKRSH